MGIKGVVDNLQEKGIHETRRIYMCRNYDLVPLEKYNEKTNALKGRIRILEGRNETLTNNCRKSMAQAAFYKALSSAMVMKKHFIAFEFSQEKIDALDALINEMMTVNEESLTPELAEEWNARLMSMEVGNKYKDKIKSLYIKEIIPKVYAESADKPVEDKVIMMESGNSPSPSSRYLARVIKEEGRYKVVYMGLRIRQVTMTEFYLNAVRFAKELATAKAVFLSTANDLLSHFEVRPETKVIQLWHGVGAFKHVGLSNIDNPNFGKTKEMWEEYDSYRNYSAVTIAAEGQSWIFEEAMDLPKEKILPVGVSRTDLFYDEEVKNESLRKLYAAYPQIEGKKTILYAPTFRGEVGKAKAPDRLDIKAMADALSDEYVLLIKHHGLSKDIPPIPEGLEDTFAFDLNKSKTLDIDRLLIIADVLITDYSSVAFEFAITERPIIFFTYDLEDYIEQRGLYFDFNNEAPGPLCRDTEEMIGVLSDLDNKFDRERLLAFKDKYVSACDGHATERTIALIEDATWIPEPH